MQSDAILMLDMYTYQRINFSLHQRRRENEQKTKKPSKSELEVHLHLRMYSQLLMIIIRDNLITTLQKRSSLRITSAVYFITIGKLWNSLPPESLCEIVNFLRISIICSLFVVLGFFPVVFLFEPSLDYNSLRIYQKHLDVLRKSFHSGFRCWKLM